MGFSHLRGEHRPAFIPVGCGRIDESKELTVQSGLPQGIERTALGISIGSL